MFKHKDPQMETSPKIQEETNNEVKSMYQRLLPWMFKSEDDKKPPKGFEKFFKKKGEVKKEAGKFLNH